MRFLGKYELLEQLTVGSVETFVAYPIGGGERLLVHVFALPALVKSGLKNSDLVEYMEAMSPKPLGSVLDAGRYDDGTQAFVVTKFPRDPNALPNWIEAYKSAAKKQDTTTVEGPVQQMWGGSKSEPKSASAAQEPVGDFTRAFQSAGLPGVAKSPLPTESFPSPLPASTQNTGDGASGEVRSDPSTLSKLTAALGEGARLTGLSPAAKPALKIDPAPSPSDLDRWEPERDSISTEEQTSDAARPGDFTNFFKSPFASPSPVSETSFEHEPLRQPQSRPAQGDFTQMFGSALPASGTREEPQKPLLEPASQSQGFTGLFGESSTPVIPPIVFPSKEPFEPTEHPERDSTSQNTNPPVFTAARPSVDPVFTSHASMESSTPVQGQVEGATRLFRPPAQATPAPEAAQGESEYTRIISAKATPAAPSANATPKQTPGGAALPKLSVPVPPPIPGLHMPGPVIAAPPPAPSVQWPATPQLQVPKVPTVSPAAEKSSKKTGWTAYVPLIVILNLLLLAAIGLVLYFIFKQ